MNKAIKVFFSFLGINTIKSLAVGESYQGGKIAYLDHTGRHGIVAAAYDQETSICWYNGINNETNTNGEAIGLGNSNTKKIVDTLGKGRYAAKLCYDLELHGFNDWYLPSKDELNELWINRELIGGFSKKYYWSSTGDDVYSAWDQDFLTGYQSNNGKSFADNVRAVRTF